MLYLVRALGTGRLRVFALALGIGSVAQLAADFGISQSVARFLAESRGDRAGVGCSARRCLATELGRCSVVGWWVVDLSGPLATSFDKPELVWPVRAIALSLFANSVFTLYVTAFIALSRIGLNLRLIFLESFARPSRVSRWSASARERPALRSAERWDIYSGRFLPLR